ncbi:MAG: 3-oxoacyl-[acyl-carrier-protein] synthase III C-terminal domain-containing protein [Alphaproteobacteria bacterium]|jgi:alkylresorcinol/alkylpyrone synthase|nr:3-oxoacyl-[acyl-carrier-protein] synthase III C-terminal domain-containing protein [Alphaproteobacteria bacterium]
MLPQARIAAVATACPPHVLEQSEVIERSREIFAPDIPGFDRFTDAYRNAAIETRHSCVPIDWYAQSHPFSERNDLFIENAVDLLAEVTEKLFAECGITAKDVDGLVVVSTTGVATPSLDALLLERLPFRRDVQRLPIFGLGCGGGVTGLARAAQLAMTRPDSCVLFLVVELCGLTFRVNDISKSNIIATALFGDGAAGALLGCGFEGPAVKAWGEHTWNDSLDVMGWEIGDDGLRVLFSRDIPHLVRSQLGAPAKAFLSNQGLTVGDIARHACHPGGAKVLDALEELYELPPGELTTAREVLRQNGNMSAATAMFVLAETMKDGTPGHWLMSALGPGFTATFALLEAS